MVTSVADFINQFIRQGKVDSLLAQMGLDTSPKTIKASRDHLANIASTHRQQFLAVNGREPTLEEFLSRLEKQGGFIGMMAGNETDRNFVKELVKALQAEAEGGVEKPKNSLSQLEKAAASGEAPPTTTASVPRAEAPAAPPPPPPPQAPAAPPPAAPPQAPAAPPPAAPPPPQAPAAQPSTAVTQELKDQSTEANNKGKTSKKDDAKKAADDAKKAAQEKHPELAGTMEQRIGQMKAANTRSLYDYWKQYFAAKTAAKNASPQPQNSADEEAVT
jgi:polyhydroxyalkanoate synthesis regulator phasin